MPPKRSTLLTIAESTSGNYLIEVLRQEGEMREHVPPPLGQPFWMVLVHVPKLDYEQHGQLPSLV